MKNQKGLKNTIVGSNCSEKKAMIFTNFLIDLLYVYKTRALAKVRRFMKPPNAYFDFKPAYLCFYLIWKPWKE